MHVKPNFLQLQSLLRHPLVHSHDIISEHAFGGSENNCVNNCPSVTNGRTGIGEFAYKQILAWSCARMVRNVAGLGDHLVVERVFVE